MGNLDRLRRELRRPVADPAYADLLATQRLLQRALDHLEAVTVAGPYGRSRDRVSRYEEARRFLRLAGRNVNPYRPARGHRPTQS